MRTIAEAVPDLDEGRHIKTALGRKVLAEYDGGNGPLAVTDVDIARALFAYAAQAEGQAVLEETQQPVEVSA